MMPQVENSFFNIAHATQFNPREIRAEARSVMFQWLRPTAENLGRSLLFIFFTAITLGLNELLRGQTKDILQETSINFQIVGYGALGACFPKYLYNKVRTQAETA